MLLGAFCAGLLTASCSISPREVGTPPEGPLREVETVWTKDAKARAEAERDRQLDEADPSRKTAPATIVDQRRWATPATHRYHRAGCSELEATPAAERQELPNAWAGLNLDFVPCPVCRPGP